MQTKCGGFTWVGRSLAVATGALLAGGLIAPAAAAQSGPAGSNTCKSERTISSEVKDFGSINPTEIHVATNQKGDAYLNDSRNPGVWVNLDGIAGTPSCVVHSSVGVDESPEDVYVTLLDKTGAAYEAVCRLTATPFDASNLVAACGTGFAPVPGTPV
ncbi:hypothetical protein [Streptomyces sp. NPDC001165]|uniref:hypothetical protein n=1 Tax=Streptomyces sp. NPDC001165 TaxID=3364546 RepID=UPI0036992475